MEVIKENLGKVAITVEKDYWTNSKAYDRLVIVELKGAHRTFISRKPVPAGANIYDREYWIPFSSLPEEFITQMNAWANRYSSEVEAVQSELQQIKAQQINNAPALNNRNADEISVANFRAAVFDYLQSKMKTVALHIKVENGFMNIVQGSLSFTYTEVDCNNESCKDFVFTTGFMQGPVLFKVRYFEDKRIDSRLVTNVINEYYLIWQASGLGMPSDVEVEGRAELHFIPVTGYEILTENVNDEVIGIVSEDYTNNFTPPISGMNGIYIQSIEGNSTIKVKATEIQ